MGVYIKGMDMPYGCANCPFVSGPVYGSDGKATYFCEVDVKGVSGNNVTTEVIALYEGAREAFPRFCPLVELPAEHGDLIDYNFFLKNYELLHDDDGNPVYAVRMRDINAAPTIIEAEDG